MTIQRRRLTLLAGGAALAAALVSFAPAIRDASAERQPHMKAALETLERAKSQLEKATADKGGHRVKAMALVEQAIGEVKQGMEFDDKH